MSKSRHTEAQMIGALKQLEAGRKAEDVAREVGVSKHTIYAWKAKYGGMDVSEAQEAKQLRDENTRLRKLVADLSLDKEALPETLTAFADISSAFVVSGFMSPGFVFARDDALGSG
jgi:putative transposase